MDNSKATSLAIILLHWYDQHARNLPWRTISPAESPDPYRVWLSEIMAQQTTVAAVIPYFERFVARWPTVQALAAAARDDVLAAWAGLGYYARARNLHACAGVLCREHGGRFPTSATGLRALPGIGPYTAAAIAAIAFDEPVAAVDGNVERVITRLRAITTPLPAARPLIQAATRALVPQHRPGDFAQALMELGALVCTPRRPQCLACPWRTACAAHAAGLCDTLPHRAPKPERPTRHAVAFWLLSPQGDAVLLRRRPPRGLLGGMLELPATPWDRGDTPPPTPAEICAAAPRTLPWQSLPGHVVHVFSHFRLEIGLLTARCIIPNTAQPGEIWTPVASLAQTGLPSLMHKLVRLAVAKQESAGP